MRLGGWFGLLAILPLIAPVRAADQDRGVRGLRDVTVLIVRHAEKPEQGRGLNARGEERARAYARYFDPLWLDGGSLRPQRLIATQDSENSARLRLTLIPLAVRLDLSIEQTWANDQIDELADSLRNANQAAVVLIAWRHERIGKLIDALGGDSNALLGQKPWPGDVYNWLVVLRFDGAGRLNASGSQRVQEHLLPGD